MFDLAVIGAGAAGLSAAVEAAQSGASVILLEKQERVGRKLLATGNGRCNFTNMNCSVSHYHGGNPDFTAFANGKFSPGSNRMFMESIGIMSREEEEGKVYPYSLQGSAVLDMLREAALQRGVVILTDTALNEIKKEDNCFLLPLGYKAEKLIIACGGKASPALGGCESGYGLLKSCGHRLTPLAPALTKIKTGGDFAPKLKGIKIQGTLVLCKKFQKVQNIQEENNVIQKESGEILFTDYGLSGPPALSLSRCLCFENYDDFVIKIDFLPEFKDEKEVVSLLKKRQENLKTSNLELFLNGIINKKAGMLLLKQALGTKLSRSVSSLEETELNVIAGALKGFALTVEGTSGWGEAQVTAGGIDTADFNDKTMESRIIPGLYACGEVLDIDGDCGGYNLQWAFAGGRLAAVSALNI